MWHLDVKSQARIQDFDQEGVRSPEKHKFDSVGPDSYLNINIPHSEDFLLETAKLEVPGVPSHLVFSGYEIPSDMRAWIQN